MSDPDLVVWLNACYDRAEQRALAATPGPWRVAECGEIETVAAYGIPGYESPLHVTCDNSGGAPSVGDNDAEYIVDLDPSWRLADIGRKRKILAKYQGALIRQESHPDDESNNWFAIGLSHAVGALAEEFDREPGYDERWRT